MGICVQESNSTLDSLSLLSQMVEIIPSMSIRLSPDDESINSV